MSVQIQSLNISAFILNIFIDISCQSFTWILNPKVYQIINFIFYSLVHHPRQFLLPILSRVHFCMFQFFQKFIPCKHLYTLIGISFQTKSLTVLFLFSLISYSSVFQSVHLIYLKLEVSRFNIIFSILTRIITLYPDKPI